MLDALSFVVVVVGRSTMRVWVEIRLGVSARVLAWELAVDMRIQRSAHGGFVESHGRRVGRERDSIVARD